MTKEIYTNKIIELDKAYNVLISAIDKNRRDKEVWQKLIKEIDSPSEDVFPINSKRDIKITYILKEIFRRGVTISTLEDKYIELNGKYEKLTNVMRRLKVNGSLVSIRYNKQNTMTFWGLSEWIEDGDFKSEFMPLKNLLPFKIVVVDKL